MQEIEASLILGQKFGALNVTVHQGKQVLSSQWPERNQLSLLNNLTYLAEKAAEIGGILSIEQREHRKSEMITTPEKMNKLLDQLPDKVMAAFDNAHVPLYMKPEKFFSENEDNQQSALERRYPK